MHAVMTKLETQANLWTQNIHPIAHLYFRNNERCKKLVNEIGLINASSYIDGAMQERHNSSALAFFRQAINMHSERYV